MTPGYSDPKSVRTAFRFGWPVGGVKRGYAHGHTDELGFKSAEDRVSVHDFHATSCKLSLVQLD